MINSNSKIFIAGHKGMVGSSLLRLFKKKKFKRVITRSKNQLNLLDQKKTYSFLSKYKPDAVIIAAAKVGGINANNKYRAEFLYQNLQIQNNIIHGSYLAGVKNLIFLGSSCIYPKKCKQPIKEKYLLTGPLEYTNEPYALAKIAGLKLIENYNKQYGLNYICLMPCNLYGQNDNYDLNTSHFLPALIVKTYLAKKQDKKTIVLWGNGKPKREIMHVDDLSLACLFFLKQKKISDSLINIGTNEEHTILEFAKLISNYFNLNLKFKFQKKYLNGTPRKILDLSVAKKYGWRAKISFNEGLDKTIKDYISQSR